MYIIASFVLFKTLSLDKKTSLKNFIVLVLKTLLNRSYNSLEWALNSPPKPHAFVSLPLQSFQSISIAGLIAMSIVGVTTHMFMII